MHLNVAVLISWVAILELQQQRHVRHVKHVGGGAGSP